MKSVISIDKVKLKAKFELKQVATQWSHPPTMDKIVQWIDGTVSGNEFVDKQNGYNLDIINKDFTISGFPIKSFALVAQKAANYGIIPDANNFWFASNGTPNQIPVIAFAQNIDNSNLIFSRTVAQVVDSYGVETTEPYITDIITYPTALTGDSLFFAKMYFSIPVTTTIDYWVSKLGLDTNTGTEALPWLTLVKGMATMAATDELAVKTGTYLESYDASYGIRATKNGTYKGLGNITIQAGSTKRTSDVNHSGALTQFERFIFDNQAQNVRANSVSTMPVLLLYQNCKFINSSASGALCRNDASYRANDLYKFVNCLLTTTGATAVNVGSCDTLIDTCYLYGTYSSAMILFNNSGAGATNSLIIQNSKLIGLSTTVLISIQFNFEKLTIKGSFLRCANGNIISTASGASGLLEFLNNTVEINATNGTVSNGGALRNSKINNNTITAVSANSCISISNDDVVEISNNTLTTNTSAILVTASTRKITSFKIEYNYIVNTSTSNPGIQLGVENTTGQNNLEGLEITGNYVEGDISKIDISSLHAIPVFWNINVPTKYNKVKNCSIGIVYKSFSLINTTAYCMYNVFYNVQYSLFSKSMSGIKYINNTVYNDHNYTTWMGIELMKNDITATVGSENTYIRNNIIVNNCQTSNGAHFMIFCDTFSQPGLDSDYNVFYAANVNNMRFQYGGTIVTSLAAWQALTGQDMHSIVINPNLDTNLVPGAAVNYATNLGATFETGLDVLTEWPTIVTKSQGATWQNGAFII